MGFWTASPEASVRAKGCVFVCPINREKQRCDVRRNGAGADLLSVRPRGFANMTERLSSREVAPSYRAETADLSRADRTRLFTSLVENLSDGIIILTFDGTVLFAHEQAARAVP